MLFADEVEGSDSQAVLTMAEQASARILALLVPGEAAPKSVSGAALTANLEALKAYEEGLEHRTRFRARDARNALERAIDLDPEFVMAHYQLADSMRFDGNVPEARRSIARAVQLAEHSPVPRLQKMLAQALQMRLDLRLEEAAKILEAAHREFPREIEPLFQLASIRAGCARFAEAAALLETVIRMDAAPRAGARSTRISVRISGRCCPSRRIHRPLCRALAAGQRGAVLQPRRTFT